MTVGPQPLSADSGRLYGIHWWGYTPGQPVDDTPATLLDCPTEGGWDTETILTHGPSWWQASQFTGLYANLYGFRNMSMITRIDYNWGETVPSPSNPDYAGWPASVVGVVNTLRHYGHIWILGNEPNLLGEGNEWPGNQVTPSGYATIYRNVRNAIRSSAQSSPAGPHILLIAPPSPGGIIVGTRWIAGTDWLAQVIDNIPLAEIDGFALHAYGGTITDFHNGYAEQLAVIDGKGLWDRPAFITEWNRAAAPGNAAEEAAAAQFCRDAFADVNTWNQTAGRHNIVAMTWFIYDGDQQAGGSWNSLSIEYWRGAGNPLGNPGDLFTAFEQTVDLRYPAGATGTPGNNLSTAAPRGTNIAPQATQGSTDSTYSSTYAGARAIDRNTATKWMSTGVSGTHWLRLDLGANRVISGYVVRHAGAGGEPATYNTQQFAIQSGASYNGPWTTEVTVDNSGQFNESARSYIVPRTLRYVRLYITDPGIDNYARIPEFEVYADPPPTAAFSATPTAARVPMTVAFTDQSIGQVTSWSWDFGDTGTSTERNPTHTYVLPGTYTVSLTVTGPFGSDTETKTACISAQPAAADFNGDGDIDLGDFANMQICYNGPNRAPTLPASCTQQDLDGDADVDLADFAIFQGCFNGPNRIPATSCLP